MPFAITLLLHPPAASRIAALWQALLMAGIDGDRHGLGYPAHITLGVYADDAPADLLQVTLASIAATWDALPVTVAGLGIFPASPAVLWAAPVPTQALLSRHAALLAALQQVVPHPHYRAGAWVPHITLSGPLADPAGAVQALLPQWQPVAGILDRAELVRFRPVEVLHSVALRQ